MAVAAPAPPCRLQVLARRPTAWRQRTDRQRHVISCLDPTLQGVGDETLLDCQQVCMRWFRVDGRAQLVAHCATGVGATSTGVWKLDLLRGPTWLHGAAPSQTAPNRPRHQPVGKL